MSDYLDERVLLAKERTALAGERNRLSNQRTFLAWTRTGLASVGGGVAIVRLLTFANPSHQMAAQIIGAVLIILGIVIFFLSLMDYRDTYKRLKVKEGYVEITATAISITLCLISLALLIISVREL